MFKVGKDTGSRHLLKATHHVRCPAQAQVVKCSGGKAGCVSLRTDHDPFDVVVDRLRQTGFARWIAAPLQHVAFDDQCAGNGPFRGALGSGADVDKYGRPGYSVGHFSGAQPLKPAAGLVERTVDTALHLSPLRAARSVPSGFGAAPAVRSLRRRTSR